MSRSVCSLFLVLGLVLLGRLAGASLACTTTPEVTLRSLPTTLPTDAVRLLSGCAMQQSDHDTLITCDDGVTLASHQQAPVFEPAYVAVANDRARLLGADAEWHDGVLVTDTSNVPMREARYTSQADGTDLGALYGISRDVDSARDDIWCIADAQQQQRCRALLTAMLQPRKESGGTTTANTSRGPPPSLLGRSLSLPVACIVHVQNKNDGKYQCGAVSIMWRTYDEMEEAATFADGLLASVPADEETAPLPCRLGYQQSVCHGNEAVIVGTAFVDGVPVTASCLSTTDDVRDSSACKSVMNGSW